MGHDKEEYVFYAKRRLEEKTGDMPAEEKLDFIIGDRAAAQNRKRRLLEEVEKLDSVIALMKDMEKAYK